MRGVIKICSIAAVFAAGMATAQSTNWLTDLLTVRSMQTEVVRSSSENQIYYLCWQDGTERFGMRIDRRNLDSGLRSLRAGDRQLLGAFLLSTTQTWTEQDNQACWG